MTFLAKIVNRVHLPSVFRVTFWILLWICLRLMVCFNKWWTTCVPGKLIKGVYENVSQIVVETWGYTGQKVQDFTIYTGTLGTAFLLLKSYQVTNNKNDLDLCSEIIKACDSASSGSRFASLSSCMSKLLISMILDTVRISDV